MSEKVSPEVDGKPEAVKLHAMSLDVEIPEKRNARMTMISGLDMGDTMDKFFEQPYVKPNNFPSQNDPFMRSTISLEPLRSPN